MKRFFGLLLLGILGVFAPVSSAIEEGGVTTLAKYFPTDFEVYASIRVDDGYVSELNQVINRVITALPAEIPLPRELDLRTLLTLPLPNRVLTYDDYRPWIGDNVAIGVRTIEDTQTSDVMLVLEIKDRSAIETIIKLATPQKGVEAGAFTVYDLRRDGTFAINDEVVIFAGSVDLLPATFDGLNTTRGFIDTVAKLPEPNYNVLMYVNSTNLYAEMPLQELLPEGYEEILPKNIAVGATILDGKSLTIDLVQDAVSPITLTPVSALAEIVPNGTDLLIGGTGISESIRQVFMLASLADANEATDSVEQIREALQTQFELDLDEDILPLFESDYGIFLSFNLNELLLVEETRSLETVGLEAGVVIHSTNEERARRVMGRITALITREFEKDSPEGATLEAYTSGTFEGLKLVLADTTAEPTISVPIVFGTNGQFIYFGLESALDKILAGDVLTNDATYQTASTLFTPDAYTVAYTDGEGVANMAGFLGLTMVSSSVIGGITDGETSDSETMMRTQLNLVFNAITSAIDSTSITAGANGQHVRAIITLK